MDKVINEDGEKTVIRNGASDESMKAHVAQQMPQFTKSMAIQEFVAALILAKREFKTIVKNKTGKIKGQNKSGNSYEYEYKYADMSAIHEAIDEALAKHGLLLCTIRYYSDKEVFWDTSLTHIMGHAIKSTWVYPRGLTPQQAGSQETYGERYSVRGLLNISVDEDDDGAVASQSKSGDDMPPFYKFGEGTGDGEEDPQVRIWAARKFTSGAHEGLTFAEFLKTDSANEFKVAKAIAKKKLGDRTPDQKGYFLYAKSQGAVE